MSSEEITAVDASPKSKWSMVGLANQYSVRPDVLLAVVIDYMEQHEKDPLWVKNTFGSIVVYGYRGNEQKPLKYVEVVTAAVNNELRPVDFVFNEATKDDIVKIIKDNKDDVKRKD